MAYSIRYRLNALASVMTATSKNMSVGFTILRSSFEFPIIVLALIFFYLILFDQEQAKISLLFVGGAYISVGPFVLLSSLAAATVRAMGLDRLIGRALRKKPLVAVVGSAIVGSFAPFCSCGVIPLITAMLAAGAPLAPIMSFWIASPLMDTQIFVLTASVINFDFAMARVMAALGMGLMAGLITMFFARFGSFDNPLRKSLKHKYSCSDAVGEQSIIFDFWKFGDRKRIFATEFSATFLLLLKWLTLAFTLESLMVAFMNPDFIAIWLGEDSLLTIPLAALVGIPAYLNGYAAVPLIDRLLDMGMSQAGALTFLTAGAVTSIPAAVAVFAIVRKRIFFWYLTLALLLSMATGIVALTAWTS